MSHSPHRLRAAFSLVELSIVLVIVGLIVGGILSGRSLIRNAAVKSVVADGQRYASAIANFRDQYRYLPGDMPTAVKFWGARAGNGSNSACYSASSTGLATCNGNGDGLIASPDGSTYAEVFLAWQHLANAGMIDGQYTGITASGSAANAFVHDIGINSPNTKMNATTFTLIGIGTWSANATWFGNHAGENKIGRIIFGTITASNGLPSSAALNPNEAFNFDSKVDDGSPAYGKIYTTTSSAVETPYCTTGATAALGAYNLSYSDPACAIYWYNPGM